MRLEDYPQQEPQNPIAAKYREACIAGSFGVAFREFAFGADPHQSVAVYPSPVPTGRALVFIHGGGWTNGYKETMAFMAPPLAAAGITLASLGHRLAPQHVFPVGFDDCAAGIRALVERAHEFGIDPKRIAIGGHSSGGHYASLLAVRRDWQSTIGLPADVIKACLPVSGVYRFGDGSGLTVRPRFLGAEGNGAETAASPVLRIEGTPPPFFMSWGEKDFPHLRTQAAEMAAALAKHGGNVETIEMPGRDHFTAHLATAEPDGPWLPRALAFLDRI